MAAQKNMSKSFYVPYLHGQSFLMRDLPRYTIKDCRWEIIKMNTLLYFESI